jgi:hypothetical protein
VRTGDDAGQMWSFRCLSVYVQEISRVVQTGCLRFDDGFNFLGEGVEEGLLRAWGDASRLSLRVYMYLNATSAEARD